MGLGDRSILHGLENQILRGFYHADVTVMYGTGWCFVLGGILSWVVLCLGGILLGSILLGGILFGWYFLLGSILCWVVLCMGGILSVNHNKT